MRRFKPGPVFEFCRCRLALPGASPRKGVKSLESKISDLAADVGERKNVATDHPERVEAMAARLEKLKADGRSRP